MNNSEIENQIRGSAPALPPALRHRVLDACAAAQQQKRAKNRRANWRLAWGFAIVFALQVFVGGWLQTQQAKLLKTENAPLFAAARDEKLGARPTSRQMRAQLLAFINLDELQRGDYVAR